MYQIIEVKDMNIEEAVALCKQEYMEEQQKTKIMLFFATPKYLKLQNAFPKVAAGNSSFLHVSPA